MYIVFPALNYWTFVVCCDVENFVYEYHVPDFKDISSRNQNAVLYITLSSGNSTLCTATDKDVSTGCSTLPTGGTKRRGAAFVT